MSDWESLIQQTTGLLDAAFADSQETYFFQKLHASPRRVHREIEAEILRNVKLHPDSYRAQHWLALSRMFSEDPQAN